jgi:CRP-like cAMP-binding protein
MIKRDDLKEMKLFSDFSDNELDMIRMVAEVERYPKEHRVIKEGERGEKLYLIARGRASVITEIEGAGEEEIKLLEIGDYFGEMSLIDDAPISASVCTRDDTELFTIDRKAFDKLIDDDMPIANKILKALIVNFSERARSTTDKIGKFYQMGSF